MIGVDYPKIEYQLFGLDLLEPMALVTNSILGFLALFFALRVSKLTSKLPFYKYWKLFFLYFGIGIFLSGLGHTFYNQLGMYGKVIGWMSGPFAIFMAEKAMVSLHWDEAKKKLLNTLIIVKVIVAYAAFAVMLVITDESKIDTQPFLPIAINTIIGLFGFVGVLGFKYTEKLSAKFKFFWLGILVLLPTALIFLMKVNIHQWFDKNDFSHIIFCIGITYFYLGVNGLAQGLKQKN